MLYEICRQLVLYGDHFMTAHKACLEIQLQTGFFYGQKAYFKEKGERINNEYECKNVERVEAD